MEVTEPSPPVDCDDTQEAFREYARGEVQDPWAETREHWRICPACRSAVSAILSDAGYARTTAALSTCPLAGTLLRVALERSSRQILVEVKLDRAWIRMRIDGVLYPGPECSLADALALLECLKTVGGMDLSETRLPQDGEIPYRSEGGQEYKVSLLTLPRRDGDKLVIVLNEPSRYRVGMDELDIPVPHRSSIERLIEQEDGLIIVTGRTESGKTSVLYAILQKLNRPEINILTFEDPVMVELAGITHVNVRRSAGLTYAAAIRAFLRGDPDVIMVDLLDRCETIEVCVRGAATGHLVLAGLHGDDPFRTFDRLAECEIEPSLLAATIRGIIGQRLVRRVCHQCARRYEPPAKIIEALKVAQLNPPGGFLQAVGCHDCGGTGYFGRVGLFEVLTMDESLGRLVVEGASAEALRSYAREHGLLWSFLEDVREKIGAGVTTVEDAYRVLRPFPVRSHSRVVD